MSCAVRTGVTAKRYVTTNQLRHVCRHRGVRITAMVRYGSVSSTSIICVIFSEGNT